MIRMTKRMGDGKRPALTPRHDAMVALVAEVHENIEEEIARCDDLALLVRIATDLRPEEHLRKIRRRAERNFHKLWREGTSRTPS